MFQFTTTNVINSRFESGYMPTNTPEDDDKHLLWSLGRTGSGEDAKYDDTSVLVLKRIATFKAKEIIEIDRAMPVRAAKAKAVVNLAPDNAEEGDTLRLNLYVGLSQGSNDAMYANDYWFKGKPLVIEYTVTKDETAENFVKNVKKFLLNVCEEKWIDFEGKGDVLTITMINEYQRFRNLTIEKLHPRAYRGMGDWEVLKSLKDLKEVKPKKQEDTITVEEDEYFAGREGFGTHDFILHNLRIPTSANSRWNAVHDDERPDPAYNYVQYTFHQCANRGPLGLNAVGQHVTSTTTHVLYVREDLRESFEGVLEQFIGGPEYEGTLKDMTYTPFKEETVADKDVDQLQ